MRRYFFDGKRTDLNGGYGCSKPGDNTGEYYLASEVDTYIAAIRAKVAELETALEKKRFDHDTRYTRLYEDRMEWWRATARRYREIADAALLGNQRNIAARATRAEAELARMTEREAHKTTVAKEASESALQAQKERDSALDKLQAKVEECVKAKLRIAKLERVRKAAKIVLDEDRGYEELGSALAECEGEEVGK